MNDYHEIVLVNKVEDNHNMKKKRSVYKMHISPQESGLVYPEFDFENLMNF